MTQEKYVTTENKWNENDTNNGRQLQNVWNENGTEYSLKTKVRWIEYDTVHKKAVGIHTTWCNEIDTCYLRATRICFGKAVSMVPIEKPVTEASSRSAVRR